MSERKWEGEAPAEPLWRLVATSVRGTSHEKTGQPCQDAHDWGELPEGVLVAAVADGAGSAALAEVGASVAARAAVEAVPRSLLFRQGRIDRWESEAPAELYRRGGSLALPFSTRQSYLDGTLAPCGRLPEDDAGWQQLLTDALQSARAAVEAEAAARAVKARDLATTLILLVATPELVAVAQIGDGAVVVSDGEDKLIALTAPQSGEYINETTFLISPNALDTAQVTVGRGRVAHVAVFSDGLQMLALKMPDGTPHAPFFAPLFRFVANVTDEAEAQQQLAAFLRSPRITERADDDLTLVLATVMGG